MKFVSINKGIKTIPSINFTFITVWPQQNEIKTLIDLYKKRTSINFLTGNLKPSWRI